MEIQEVTGLRIGDVVRFRWITPTKTIDEVQVVTKEWSEHIDVGGYAGYCVATTGYRITSHNRHLFTKIA